MKVKTKKSFIDKHTGKVHKAGEVFTVTKERFDEIQKVGDLVEVVVEEKKPTEKAKPAKKKAE